MATNAVVRTEDIIEAERTCHQLSPVSQINLRKTVTRTLKKVSVNQSHLAVHCALCIAVHCAYGKQ
jgi:hypothetical protein